MFDYEIFKTTLEDELKPDSKLFPIHEDYVTILFIEINNILKLGKKGTYNRFRSHMLRSFMQVNYIIPVWLLKK